MSARLLLLPLTLCSYLFGAMCAVRTLLYDRGILRSREVPCAVITVGNITVGGTGKTPTVILLARCLQQQGLRVAVLTRGYRGTKTGVPQVVSDGRTLHAQSHEVGDEAFMMAEKLPGIPVLAGKDRVAAAVTAQKRFHTRICILDDGFQHRRLKRNLDIVLINSTNPFGNGFLLPRGILREPLSSLKRAQVILLTKTVESGADITRVETALSHYNPQAALFRASYRISALRNVRTGEVVAPDILETGELAALCSIGDPESFFSMLEAMGARGIRRLVFPDHHSYSEKDYDYINQSCTKINFLITTEKDIAKIDITMLKIFKLFVLEIEQKVENEHMFVQQVKKLAGT